MVYFSEDRREGLKAFKLYITELKSHIIGIYFTFVCAVLTNIIHLPLVTVGVIAENF